MRHSTAGRRLGFGDGLLLCVVAVASGGPCLAADGTWNGSAGNWSSAGIWDGGAIATGADATAFFTAELTANRTVTVDTDRTIGNLTFTDGATASNDLTIAGSTGNSLALDVTSGSPTISVTQSGRKLTVTSVVSGTAGLTKTGDGRLFLNNAANTFSGPINLDVGSLQMNGDGNLGDADNDLAVGGPFTIYTNFGGTIALPDTRAVALAADLTILGQQGNNRAMSIAGPISGAGGLALDGATSDLTLLGANSFQGAISVAAGGTTSGVANDTLLTVGDGPGNSLATLGDGSNAVTLNGLGTGTVGSSVVRFFRDDYTFGGDISGTGRLWVHPNDTNFGSGSTITLTGTNTYGGETVVQQGALRVDTSASLSAANLQFNGTGVLIIGGDLDGGAAADFARGVGGGSGQVQWTNGGGFAAAGADRSVNLGGSGAALSWDTDFGNNNYALFLGHPDADATVTLENPIGLTGTGTRNVRVFDGTADVDGELSGGISGTGVGLVKNETGTLLLSGSNSYDGVTNIAAGAIRVESPAALGGTSGVEVTAGGGRLELNNLSAPIATPLTLRGNGGTGNPGALSNVAGDNTYAGAITLASAARIKNTAAGTTLTLDVASGDAISGTAQTLTIDGDGDLVVADPVTLGSGGITKVGPGTTTLQAASNFSGGIALNNGTLLLAGDQSGVTGGVTVAADARLGGTASLAAPLTVSGTLAPGASIGTLTVAADVTWNGGATAGSGTDWVFELDTGNAADLLEITSVGSDFLKGTGSVFRFDFAGSTATGSFDLVRWDGTTDFTAGDFSFTNYAGGVPGSFAINGDTLQFTAVPEPAVALAGLAAAMLCLARARRRAASENGG